ncbi:hypothetical protein ACIBI9_00505 [Nonomuraea sp. NPDC050451]|uniref:hypothetical protein n=1 Tax=Nonomuraea sp. NPDC050451 TaxID=3364364 RepID=UPI0037972B01
MNTQEAYYQGLGTSAARIRRTVEADITQGRAEGERPVIAPRRLKPGIRRERGRGAYAGTVLGWTRPCDR